MLCHWEGYIHIKSNIKLQETKLSDEKSINHNLLVLKL
mgnify:CR=1 FL=1